MNFEKTFEDWLEKSLEIEVPSEIKAFSFNLYESAYEEGYEFGIELIGAEKFDINDSDWACEEIWESSPRKLFIPISYSGEKWEECLEKMKSLVTKVLYTNKKLEVKLKSRNGVGIGFIDGDLAVIWSKNN